MKINDLIQDFIIHTSNEEAAMLERLNNHEPLSMFTEREQFVIQNLVKKSLVSKVVLKGQTLVVKNDQRTDT